MRVSDLLSILNLNLFDALGPSYPAVMEKHRMNHINCIHHFMSQAPPCRLGMVGDLAESWMPDVSKLVYTDLYDEPTFNGILATTVAKYQGFDKGKKLLCPIFTTF